MIGPTSPVRLFSYGTLQEREVQIANFGRELNGHEDALPGYCRRMLAISGSELPSSDAESYYFNVEPSSNSEDIVPGMVYEITGEELAAADQYEAVAHYRRTLVTLRSGHQAWVYAHAASI